LLKIWVVHIQVGKTTRASDWGISNVSVGHGVDFYDEGWKEDMHTQTVHPDEATTALALMSLKTVEGVTEVWYVKTVPD
jgi:transcription elongation GreA/GreB family factor